MPFLSTGSSNKIKEAPCSANSDNNFLAEGLRFVYSFTNPAYSFCSAGVKADIEKDDNRCCFTGGEV